MKFHQLREESCKRNGALLELGGGRNKGIELELVWDILHLVCLVDIHRETSGRLGSMTLDAGMSLCLVWMLFKAL